MRWQRDNLRTICENLSSGFRGSNRNWSYRHKSSKILRRGKRLPNGDMLWMEGGRLYIERLGV